MSRWSRASRILDIPRGSRVLDLGCAFGFGTRLLVERYATYGHDLSPEHIERARWRLPQATFTQGPADLLPYADGFFDAVLLLDVLEHVPNDGAVIEEIARVLRAGGKLVLSVPNTGLLPRLDSLNLYRQIMGSGAPAPTDDPSWHLAPRHRHYSAVQLRALLHPHFRLTSTQYTGVGIAEPVNLALLLFLRGLFRLNRVYAVLQYIYFAIYLLEDTIETGPWGYHLMVTAVRTPTLSPHAPLPEVAENVRLGRVSW